MGYERLGYLVFRLKLGDDNAWNHIKTLHNEMLNIVIVSDLLDNDLPLSLHPIVLEKTWERAFHRIGEFQHEEGMDNRAVFLWLLSLSRKFQQQLALVYHDIDSRQFINMLQHPRNEADREDFNWAWKYISKHHERTLMATIHAVLASRMAFTPDDVSDIWQRAYLNIQRRIHEFTPQFKGALLRWMHTHVRNESLNFYRVHITKQHRPLEDVEYQLGIEFEDPLDGEEVRKQALRRAYYDALIDIILELPNKSASQVLSVDQQRRAIKRLFDGKFEKPIDVANALSVDTHVIHNLVRVIKRRLEKREHLAQHIRTTETQPDTIDILERSSNQ